MKKDDNIVGMFFPFQVTFLRAHYCFFRTSDDLNFLLSYIYFFAVLHYFFDLFLFGGALLRVHSIVLLHEGHATLTSIMYRWQI